MSFPPAGLQLGGTSALGAAPARTSFRRGPESEPPPPTPLFPSELAALPSLATVYTRPPDDPESTEIPFVKPRRRIGLPEHMAQFQASRTYQLITWFVFSVVDSARGTPISKAPEIKDDEESPIAAAARGTLLGVLAALDRVDGLVDKHPAEDNAGSRFGNPAFRAFYDELASKQFQQDVHCTIVRNNLGRQDDDDQKLGQSATWRAAVAELGEYLSRSFGDRQRVDYGSGHELNFFLWLLGLDRVGLLVKNNGTEGASQPETTNTDAQTAIFRFIALRIFPRYLAVVRRLQSTYYLEPAGSLGVWGLDDYQFLPFLIGAAQLTEPEHRYFRPRSVNSPVLVEEARAEWLYFDQVDWVAGTKLLPPEATAPSPDRPLAGPGGGAMPPPPGANVVTSTGLGWHSPLLSDISTARSWAKIEGGLRKMFVRDLLGKLPVVQHLFLGAVIVCPDELAGNYEDDGEEEGHCQPDEHGHVHGEGEKDAVDADGNVILGEDGKPLKVPVCKHDHDFGADPCGIKVPSGIAAVMEMRKRQQRLRALPFD